MDSVHRLPPSDALGEIQFFAVPHRCVVSVDDQAQMWLWFGDTMIPIDRGAFVVRDTGLLVFEPNND